MTVKEAVQRAAEGPGDLAAVVAGQRGNSLRGNGILERDEVTAGYRGRRVCAEHGAFRRGGRGGQADRGDGERGGTDADRGKTGF